MDSSSYDIRAATVNGTWASAAEQCAVNPYCLGVNTGGWMKYFLRNQTDWTTRYSDVCQGLLVKQGGWAAGSTGLLNTYVYGAGLYVLQSLQRSALAESLNTIHVVSLGRIMSIH